MVITLVVDDLLTTGEAAKKLGVSAGRVRQLVVDGRLPVVRLGRDNLIRTADLALVKDRQTGRPRKPSTSERRSVERKSTKKRKS
jgi:excisionase family DNA binding protein